MREVVLQLKLGEVDCRALGRKFDVDVVRVFAGPLDDARRHGWIALNDAGVTVTREGLIRVDRWLTTFYEPAHQGARYS